MLAETNDRLRALGFVQQRFFNFCKPGYLHQYNRLSAAPGANIFALGPGSYGVVNGYSYVNHADLDAYLDCVERGHLPIAAGLPMDDDEIKRSFIVTSLLELRLDPKEYKGAFGSTFEDDFGNIVTTHLKEGLFRVTENEVYELTDLGILWGDNVATDYFSTTQRHLFDIRFDPLIKPTRGRHYNPASLPANSL